MQRGYFFPYGSSLLNLHAKLGDRSYKEYTSQLWAHKMKLNIKDPLDIQN